MSRPEDVLEFWFGKPGEEGYGEFRKAWFGPDEDFDARFRERFLEDFEEAAAGRLKDWEQTPEGALALIILLDQGSSMLFRGNRRAFETDPLSLAVARRALERGFDQRFPELHRWFFYLPFEHSEDPADQARAVELFSRLEPTEANLLALDYAVRHQRVIERFGRFPNRNAALGRESTPEELEFLAGPDAPF